MLRDSSVCSPRCSRMRTTCRDRVPNTTTMEMAGAQLAHETHMAHKDAAVVRAIDRPSEGHHVAGVLTDRAFALLVKQSQAESKVTNIAAGSPHKSNDSQPT